MAININLNNVESTSNKAIDFSIVDDIKYPTVKAVQDQLDALPAELTPDELDGIQNANGLNAANPVATIADLNGKGLQEVTDVNNETTNDVVFRGKLSTRQRIDKSFTETTFDDTRPVIEKANYTYSPSENVAVLSDFHGIDHVHIIDSPHFGNGSVYGLESQVINAASSGDARFLIPFLSVGRHTGNGNVVRIVNHSIRNFNSGSGTVGAIYGLHFQTPVNSGGGAINNVYGIKIDNLNNGANNNFGIHISGASGGSMRNFGVWSEAVSNYFKGLRVGGNNGSSATSILEISDVADANQYFRAYGTGRLILGGAKGTIDTSTFTRTADVEVGNNVGSTGTSFLVRTPSLSNEANSGFGVDGAYASNLSTIRMTAFGVRAGIYSSQMLFRLTSGTSVVDSILLTLSGLELPLAPTAANHATRKDYVDGKSITNTSLTVAQTASDLNTLYPTATDGLEVKCPNITPPTIYKKTSVTGQWMVVEATVLNP